MDLIDQSTKRGDRPAYFMVIVNINTRYAYAYPLDGKGTADLLGVLKKWVDEVEAAGKKVVHLSADQEAGWSGQEVQKWLDEKKIRLKLIPSDRHSALGIVDRFIRTLRDMNVRSKKRELDDQDLRDFSVKRMTKFLATYNASLHNAIGMTPTEMEKDDQAQKRYIIKQLYNVHGRKKITDYVLGPGTWVRFMLPRDKMGKRRFQVSPGIVQVKKQEGNSYILMAEDGSVKTVSRWRLIPVKDPEKYKHMPTFGVNVGIIEAIIGGPRQGKYQVRWQVPQGAPEQTTWESVNHITGQVGGQQMLDDYTRAHPPRSRGRRAGGARG
jgi:hypothetical protein